MIYVYLLAAIGAGWLISLHVKAWRQFRKDLKSKPTPWLGGPMGRGPLNGH